MINTFKGFALVDFYFFESFSLTEMSAEKGAYLATSAAPLPTLFEVLAASNLSDLLKPIVGHLTDCLVSWKPEWHRLLVPARKIAWILAILGVDGYHLKHYGTFDFVFVDS